MKGTQGYSNQRMQEAIASFPTTAGYSLKISDEEFLTHVNNPRKPFGYPEFTL